MNLLCPNCQKMLTVPDQYAGQMMKCPLCSANFTVPALPAGASSAAPVPAFGDSPGGGSPAPEQETYGVKSDPVPAFSTSAASNPPAAPSTPTPAFSTGGNIPVPPATPSPASTPPPSSPPSASSGSTSGTSTPSWNFSSTSSGTTEPSESMGFVLDPKILQYVPVASLVLIFFLHFFPWVGVYVGGYEITSQGAWGTAVGATSKINGDLLDRFSFKTDKMAQEAAEAKLERLKTEGKIPKDTVVDKSITGNDPQFSLLTFFYLLPLFFIGLAVSVGVVALPYIQVPLPPQVQQILPWRWAIVAGINALLLLFVALQYLLPFSLESRVASYVNADLELRAVDTDKSTVALDKQIERGKVISQVQRTTWFNLVVLLHLIAAVTAGLVYWIEKRGPGKPLPRVEVRY